MTPIDHAQEPIPFIRKPATLQRIPAHFVTSGTQFVQSFRDGLVFGVS